MTDVVCSGCLSRQPAGTQYCGVCGHEFPRTGGPVAEQQSGPPSAVQQPAGSGYGTPHGAQDLPYHHGGSRVEDEFHTGTFVPVRDPGPAPAAPEPVYAHVGRRIAALLLDGGVGGLLYGAFALALVAVADAQVPEGEISVDANTELRMAQLTLVGLIGGAALSFLWGLAMWLWEGKTGKTLGNLALGIRTLSADGLEPIGFWRVVLRNLLIGASGVVPLVGPLVMVLSPLWDHGGRAQGWHDKVAGAVVVDVTRKPVPVVAGFDPDSRPRAPERPGRSISGSGGVPATPPPGALAPAAGPASPGALRAAGQGYTAASSADRPPAHHPSQHPGQAPAPGTGHPAPASFTPDGAPAPAQPDPWAFPETSGTPGGGLITNVPGGASAPYPPVPPGQGQEEPATRRWPSQQPGTQQPAHPHPQPPERRPGAQQPSPPPQRPMLPGAPPPAPPETSRPTTASTPSPPATPNSPQPITAANTIPDHPMLETSPYPPISQPQRRDSQPTRAVGLDGPGPRQRAPYGQAPAGQHAAAPGPAPAEPTSDETIVQAPVQTPSGPSRAMDPAPVLGAVLELDSGEMVRVDGPTLVGRNPQAPGSAGVRLVQLPDPTRSVSKNHAELGVDSAGLWLTDRGSTNGTVVSVPGLPPRVAEAGARVRVPVGSTIHFGDRRVVVHPGAGEG